MSIILDVDQEATLKNVAYAVPTGDSTGKTVVQRIAVMFLAAGLVMWLIFSAAQWYADNSSLPRYCSEPAVAIEHVRKILTTQRPVGARSKRPFVVAAKLIFLIPRADGEAVEDYLQRLRLRIDETCRTS